MRILCNFLIFNTVLSLILVRISFAAELDNGTDANGQVIVSEVLAQRCGLSSAEPAITDDCIKRLAYDYKTGTPPGYESYNAERKAILNDYAAAYLHKSVTQMIAGGDYGDHIDELIKQDPTASYSLDNDGREKMEASNDLVSDSSSLLLQIMDLRAATIYFENLNGILSEIVPQTDVDTSDTSLGLPPTQQENTQ